MRRPFSHRFVLRTFARLESMADQVDYKELAAGLREMGLSRDAVGGLGQHLLDVAEMMGKDPEPPRCAGCGQEWDDHLHRKDIRYCSPKCKQRAYRKRVTPKRVPQSEDVTKTPTRDASHHAGSDSRNATKAACT